jgi:hypothetical protein
VGFVVRPRGASSRKAGRSRRFGQWLRAGFSRW